MIELAHGVEPVELSTYRTSATNPSWEDPTFGAIRPTIRHCLNNEQSELCIYCERELGRDDGHVEHIKARSRRSDLIFTYSNLAHSCDGPKHCGHHKKGQILPIEPVVGCNNLFSLSAIDGTFTPINGSTQQQQEDVTNTVRILGLNNAKISWLRKGYLDSLLALNPDERADFLLISPFRWSLERV